MNTKQRAESREQRNQRARRLNAIRVEMAYIAQAAAEDVLLDEFPYACDSIKKVVENSIAFPWRMIWRVLMLDVFKVFRPARFRDPFRAVWWEDGDASVRALALLFLQQMIERASLDEVETWVRTYAPELLADEGPKAQAGKPMLRGKGGLGV